MSQSPGCTYIVKPPGAAQGDGIFLVQVRVRVRVRVRVKVRVRVRVSAMPT